MGVKIGINGFGRIGRNVFRVSLLRDDIEIVAVNDLADAETLAFLLKYDSVHGELDADVRAEGGAIVVNGRRVQVFSARDPGEIPWDACGAEIVVESTGRFTDARRAADHLRGSVKKVIITAPANGEDLTVVMGVNEQRYDPDAHHILSNASCTTNCLAPMAKIIHTSLGIVRGMMTTVHSYTNDQQILDLAHHDLRRARAAAMSIIPTSTGAAQAVSLVLPELDGRLHGIAMRVPTPDVSVVDFVAEVEQDVTTDALNRILREAAETDYQGIVAYTEKPLVSVDFRGNPHSAIIDSLCTKVLGNRMVKVVAWYDNEWGYSNRVADLASLVGKRLKQLQMMV
jgi:glyceraldehyde 3-phosphate dehydrogenase